MNRTKLVLHLVPREFWKSQEDSMVDISPFVEDAFAIERRITKGVNLSNERMRYQLCCKRIQEAVSGMVPVKEKMVLRQSYYNLLHILFTKFSAQAAQGRLAACFFPPDMIEEHLNAFKSITTQAGLDGHEDIMKRMEFFNKAIYQKAGVVEIADFLAPGETEKSEGEVSLTGVVPLEALQPVYEEEDELTEEKRETLLEIFKSQIQKALDNGGEVNFSNQPHYVIADALNEFVYNDGPDEPEKTIRVVYMDGSEAEPFPLRCLTRPTDLDSSEDVPALKASLISMRHLKMDEKVHFAWFRNSKVSVSRSFAETDAYCTERTIELLSEMENKEFHLDLYQTGLETAVIGFYRGLVRVLKERRKAPKAPPLCVVPYYLVRGDDYRPGQPWA